jgi:tartrate dehydrogenase/decarboxylase/D-malate dehydrogenase
VGHQLARRRDAALDECRGQKPAADRFLKAVERATANKSLHTPDLGGKATTKQVTEAVCETLRSAND